MTHYKPQPNTTQKLNIWLPLLFALVLIIGMFLGFQLQKGNSGSTSLVGAVQSGQVEELLRFIEMKYVDEVNTEELREEAIMSVLKKLDPHSSYIPAKQLASVNEELEGKFEGVGIQFTVLDDTIYVISPISGGPADKLGILAGDKIVEIEDSIVAGIGMQSEDVIDRLKGKKGTKVNIGIMRGQKKDVIPYTIERDEIPLYSVDASYMINDNTGYIKINRFSGQTFQEFMQALEKLREEGLENIVIDLRQNPGGYLTAATKILNQLFDESQLLVYTKGRTYSRNNYKSNGRNFYPIKDVAVLIDEGSASASEILAGAVQDNDRGVVVGRRSFGKGLVQEQYNLSDGAALRLTVARYYTPSGRSIQKPYDDLKAYNEDFYTRLNSGELSTSDSISVEDTTKYYTQNGRVVYGGGGVIPDVFIPLDTTYRNEAYAIATQFVPQFVYNYMDTNKGDFEQYGSLKKFNETYNISNETFDQFIKYVEKEKVKVNRNELSKVRKSIELRLKAYFARQLFRDTGFFYVLNYDDPTVKAAIENMDKPLK